MRELVCSTNRLDRLGCSNKENWRRKIKMVGKEKRSL